MIENFVSHFIPIFPSYQCVCIRQRSYMCVYKYIPKNLFTLCMFLSLFFFLSISICVRLHLYLYVGKFVIHEIQNISSLRQTSTAYHLSLMMWYVYTIKHQKFPSRHTHTHRHQAHKILILLQSNSKWEKKTQNLFPSNNYKLLLFQMTFQLIVKWSSLTWWYIRTLTIKKVKKSKILEIKKVACDIQYLSRSRLSVQIHVNSKGISIKPKKKESMHEKKSKKKKKEKNDNVIKKMSL